ncbi:hypothetical protein ACP70R_002966 [Stipagrostis hirtigluma subsp. patula]
MADHQEMIHAVPATATRSGGDWWSSPDQLPGFSASWSATAAAAVAGHVDGNRLGSGNAASSESPGSNSLATGGSSITLQEPAGVVVDPATAAAVPQPTGSNFVAGWSQPYYLDGSAFHGYTGPRNDHGHINAPSLTSPSSNHNMMMLQDQHDQNHQFLSSLGLELLSSPTSPSAGFRSSSLLRSLTEPAAATRPSPGFQEYQQRAANQAAASVREALQFSNNTPFWNPSTGLSAPAEGTAILRTAGSPSAQSTPESFVAKSALEGVGDSSSAIKKKANTDPTPLKKARTGTPSPLPTFKVRKEKLGDRITALQQLVSPFGKVSDRGHNLADGPALTRTEASESKSTTLVAKSPPFDIDQIVPALLQKQMINQPWCGCLQTDTASVLHETIEYIKFLHEQVGSLSAPYLKNRQQVPLVKVSKDGGEAAKGDLTGRGLCLVPISSTFAVASETPIDFWTPFGSVFR